MINKEQYIGELLCACKTIASKVPSVDVAKMENNMKNAFAGFRFHTTVAKMEQDIFVGFYDLEKDLSILAHKYMDGYESNIEEQTQKILNSKYRIIDSFINTFISRDAIKAWTHALLKSWRIECLDHMKDIKEVTPLEDLKEMYHSISEEAYERLRVYFRDNNLQ